MDHPSTGNFSLALFSMFQVVSVFPLLSFLPLFTDVSHPTSFLFPSSYPLTRIQAVTYQVSIHLK